MKDLIGTIGAAIYLAAYGLGLLYAALIISAFFLQVTGL